MDVFIDNGYGQQCPISLYANIMVERQLFFGQVPIAKLSGFKDWLSGKIITNAFTTGIFDLNDVLANWREIESEKEITTPVLFTLTGLVGWDPRDPDNQ